MTIEVNDIMPMLNWRKTMCNELTIIDLSGVQIYTDTDRKSVKTND